MSAKILSLLSLAIAGLLVTSNIAHGEAVELINGDVVHGKVLSLDGKLLKLKSESFGELLIERRRIATIRLVAKKAQPSAQLPVPSAGKSPQGLLGRLPSPDEALRKFLTDGKVSDEDMKAVQQRIPLATNPEVQGFVTDRLSGLFSGRLNVNDIRKEAVGAVDQIKDLQRDLGPQAKALNGYLSILEDFISKTQAPEAEQQPAEEPAEQPQR